METNPSTFAREYRLREWEEMIRECQNRPAGVTIKEWCMGQQAAGLDLTIYGAQIRVTNETTPELPKMVLGVIAAFHE